MLEYLVARLGWQGRDRHENPAEQTLLLEQIRSRQAGARRGDHPSFGGFGQKALHTLVALATILSCRFLVGSYGRSWSRDHLLGLLSIGISDMVAGVVYYVITEYLMQSVYPFLLTFSLFALICVVSLFARLLYRGVNEAAQMTEQ